ALDMLARVQHSVAREEELLVSPRLFPALLDLIPEIDGIEICLKRGRHHNELTRYRYDVILHIGSDNRAFGAATVNWQRDSLSPEDLRGLLAANTCESLLVQNVPNSRLIGEIEALRLARAEPDQLAGDLRRRAAVAAAAACDPEELCRIGEELSYQARPYLPASLDHASFDVLFSRRDGALRVSPIQAGNSLEPVRSGRLNSYVNNP